MKRRTFLHNMTLLGTGYLILPACSKQSVKGYRVNFNSPDAALGHRLRNPDFPVPSREEKTDILIAGAGISGLSTAWHLKEGGISDFLILDLEKEPGGNSRAGQNDSGFYPLGAHYLPIPDPENQPLIHFLEKNGIITSYSDMLPVYREDYLCRVPEERLWIHQRWQEGLIPRFSLQDQDLQELHACNQIMEQWKQKKGKDGRYAFAIPLEYSSQDEDFLSLENINFDTWLREKGFKSEALFWYVNYCCLDDYGIPATECSARAGIHYFASRRGRAYNASEGDVLTWPEGNQFLVKKLSQSLGAHLRVGQLTWKADKTQDGWEVSVWDAQKEESVRVQCKKLVMATPLYVSQRILSTDMQVPDHEPWLVANLLVDDSFNTGRGAELSWDNVPYGSTSLGYVNASHQKPELFPRLKTLTFYQPLSALNGLRNRKDIAAKDSDFWENLVMEEMKKMHPDLPQGLLQMDLWIWGHAMAAPKPGLLHRMPELPDNLFLAHSDLAGYSIFEEAFHYGWKTAQSLLSQK